MPKYQVFVGSAASGMEDERESIINSILTSKDFFPISMEHFAAHRDTIRALYSYLKQSDVYLLILKNKQEDGKSSLIMGSTIDEGASSLRFLMDRNEEIETAVKVFLNDNQIECEEDLTFTQVEYIIASALGLCIGVLANRSAGRKLNCVQEFGIPNTVMVGTWQSVDELVTTADASLDGMKIELEEKHAGWYRKDEVNMLKVAQKHGIRDLVEDDMQDSVFSSHLEKAKELNVFFTTGYRFAMKHRQKIVDYVAGGGVVKFLCVRPGSVFLDEVAEVERINHHRRKNENIHNEFQAVIDSLQAAWDLAKDEHAKRQKKGADVPIGNIMLGCTDTLFRSTMVLCIYENGLWGRITPTLPPKKSGDMLSIELDKEYDENSGLAEQCQLHFEKAWEMAVKNGYAIDLADEMEDETIHEIMNHDLDRKARIYWEDKWNQAKKNQRAKSKKKYKKVLIEIAAQHPLKDECEPDSEFAARLERGYELYLKKKKQGKEVEIYIPGSIHLEQDKDDPDEYIVPECSLSEAGVAYLLEKGIAQEDIHGEEWNNYEIPGREVKGVYNSADECFVASYFFNLEEEQFGELICVCSPNQVARKTLFYLENGVMPQVYSVPVDKMFHNIVGEVFDQIPYILLKDHNWQRSDSKEANRTRCERMPGYAEE